MSLTPAERVGVAGAVLLSGALVAAAILALGGGGRTEEPDSKTATGTASDGPSREPDPAALAESRRVPDLRREIRRLRKEIEKRDLTISQLQDRLKTEGLTIEASAVDATATAKEAMASLEACGPETSPADIEVFLARIVAGGAASIEPVKAYLARGIDTSFSEAWNYYGDRFTAYPTLRIALLDVLRRIAAGEAVIEGQAAMVAQLRRNENPLEICLLVSALSDVKGVETVDEIVLDGARRFLTLEPHPRERYLLSPVIAVLAAQSPSAAGRDLLAYFVRKERKATPASVVLPLIAGLPEEVAVPTLTRAVLEAAAVEKKERAARLLARSKGERAHQAIREVLTATDPKVQSAIYESLPRVSGEKIASLERTALREGLSALAALDRFDVELAARRAILAERAAVEENVGRRREIESALKRLLEFEERGKKLRKRLRG